MLRNLREQNKWVRNVSESEDEVIYVIYIQPRELIRGLVGEKQPTSATKLLEPLQTR